jgi:hypothetical protein
MALRERVTLQKKINRDFSSLLSPTRRHREPIPPPKTYEPHPRKASSSVKPYRGTPMTLGNGAAARSAHCEVSLQLEGPLWFQPENGLANAQVDDV